MHRSVGQTHTHDGAYVLIGTTRSVVRKRTSPELLTEESIIERVGVSDLKVDQNSPATLRGIAMEATS